MKFIDYWNNLKKALEEFDVNNKVKASSLEDQKCYDTQRKFLNDMVVHGTALANASWFSKLRSGPTFYALPEKIYGPKRVLQQVDGPLSLALAEKVYFPHLQKFSEVTLDDQSYFVKKLINIEEEKNIITESVKLLGEAIEKYKNQFKNKLSPHLTHSLMAHQPNIIQSKGIEKFPLPLAKDF